MTRIVLSLLASLALVGSACGLVNRPAAVVPDDTTITLVAADSPQTLEIIATLKDELSKQGFDLKHVVVNDIVLPNKMVEEKQADANMFEHEVYMKQWNADHGTHIVPAFYTTFLPAGLFSKKYTDIKALPDGARVGLPVDPANEGRALMMLQDNGLLTVKPGIDVVHLSVHDVTDNPHKLQFIEVDQQMLLRTLDDVDIGFLFGGTAVQSGLTLSHDALAVEHADGNPYKSIIGTRAELLGTPKIQALQHAYQSDHMKQTLLKLYSVDTSAVVFLW